MDSFCPKVSLPALLKNAKDPCLDVLKKERGGNTTGHLLCAPRFQRAATEAVREHVGWVLAVQRSSTNCES